MFLQNFIKLSAAVHELSWLQKNTKNCDENNTARRYRAHSKKTAAKKRRLPTAILIWQWPTLCTKKQYTNFVNNFVNSQRIFKILSFAIKQLTDK